MKLKVTLLLCLISNIVLAQLKDSFEDGNFDFNPAWSGNNSDWQIINQQLQLNAQVAGVSYLSTPSLTINDATWEIWLKMEFNPSASNYAKIYLVSNQPDLTQPLIGYYIKVGDSEDEISLYYQQGDESTKIIDGSDSRLDMDQVNVRIKVTRDDAGNWELFSDVGDSGNFISEGIAFDDQAVQSNYFGIYTAYTKTRIDRFFFDDINVTGLPYKDNDAPVLQSVNFDAADQLSLMFSEPLNPTLAEDVNNYSIEGIGNPQTAGLDPSNSAKVILQFASSFQDANFYNIEIIKVSDTNNNVIAPISKEIFYFENKQATPLQVVINELMPDPTPLVNLPEVEYIELYNNSATAFNLKNWTISDNLTEGILDSAILLPDEYLVLVPAGNKEIFDTYGTVLEVTNWPSLNNGGDLIYLKDNLNSLIDSVVYTIETYQDANKQGGGWSLERIFPSLNCPSVNNWSASVSNAGGTPGAVNSIYSETPDQEAPGIHKVDVLSDNQVKITFSEGMDENSLLNGTYQLQPELIIQNISTSQDLHSVSLTFQQSLQVGINYELSIQNVTDCMGNQLMENSVQFNYDISPPQLLEIIFTSKNEMSLLFSEPLLTDSALKKNNYVLNSTIYPELVSQPDPELVELTLTDAYNLASGQTLTIQNLSDMQGNILPDPVETAFTFQDQIDTVFTKGENHILLIFKEIPAKSSAEKVSNYLLNKSKSPVTVFIDENNEMAYHLIFDEGFSHDTWYQLYVQDIFNDSGNRIATPAYSFYVDKEAPEIINLQIIDENNLLVHFNEKVDPVTAAVLVNYEINKSVGYPQSLSLKGDSAVALTFNQALQPNENYTLEINYVQDVFGNAVSREREQFIYDQQNPEILEWQLIYPAQLIISFNENLEAASIAHENFNLNGQSIPEAEITLVSYDQSKLIIDFVSLEDNMNYQLEISGLKDKNENVITPYSLDFNTILPQLGKIDPLADSIVLLSFSEIINQAEALQPENFKLNNEYEPVQIVYLDHQLELVFNQHFHQSDSQKLTVTNLKDLSGNVMAETSSSFIYDDFLHEIVIENDNTLSLEFELPVDASLLSEQLFSLHELGNPFLILADNNDDNRIKLVFDIGLKDNESYWLTIKSFQSKAGLIIPSSSHQFKYDRAPPQLIDLIMDYPKQLHLIFSEAVSKSGNNAEYYQISNFGTPENVLVEAEKVILFFADNFVDQQQYTLMINGLSDLAGNRLINFDYSFKYTLPRLPQFNEIIITEIMAAPSPPVGLPEVEYLEIYNRSEFNLPVNDLIISDG
ncbi:MAG: Ig-like domain-containing protein, partial [Cyclobacteriaceae bacterium]